MSYVEIFGDILYVYLIGRVKSACDYVLDSIDYTNFKEVVFDFMDAKTIDSFFVYLAFKIRLNTKVDIRFVHLNKYCRDVLDMACMDKMIDY